MHIIRMKQRFAGFLTVRVGLSHTSKKELEKQTQKVLRKAHLLFFDAKMALPEHFLTV